MKGGLSQIIEEKLSSSSSTASTTLSIEDCRDTVRMAAQFFPIDNQYLAPICDKEILSYLFLIQHSLMKGITCKVVERILNRRLKSDQEELKSLKEELNQQKSKKKDSNDNIDKEQEFSEIECTEDMIDQYDFDIERQKKVLCSWQKGNFSQCAEEIKMRVFEYKKGIIFQEEVEKELVRYITSLSDKNVQGIFKRFEDILHISKGNSQQLKMLLHIHPELVIIHVLNINMANIINKVVDKSIKVSRELEEDIDHSTQNLSREHSMSFKILSSISMIIAPISMIIAPLPVLYYIFTHTSALAITHIYNTYANYQYGGPIRKKVQDIAAELDINYKSYLKKSIEENPSNKLGKPGVQEIANNNQKL